MKRVQIYLTVRDTFRALFLLVLVFSLPVKTFAQDSAEVSKISPTIKLSYKIIDDKKSIKVEVTKKEGKKYTSINNIIVNLYNGEVKKYDQADAKGWVGNMVTDEEGVCEFVLTEKFKKLTAGTHVFTFIASIGSDPVYEDTQEEIIMTDAFIKLSSIKDDSLTTVVAKLSKYTDTAEAVMPETEMKLFVKHTFGNLPFGEENLSTDENGEVSGILPPDLPGNPDKSITVVARYEDAENDGIIEVSTKFPWEILPAQNQLSSRTLWSSGTNAPVPLVIVTVGLIILIWGTILYLISFLFKIKKLGVTKKTT